MIDVYFSALGELLKKVETTQKGVIEQAAVAIADAMAAGNCVHIFDTGHMLSSELINRAGGLTAFRALNVNLQVEDDVRKRPSDKEGDRSLDGVMKYALKMSKCSAGDVIVIGSVSGKSVLPVDLALEAKAAGIYTIAMTSVSYSSQLKSDHKSGLRLFEAVDLVIDNCVPPLDAMIELPNLEAHICPGSGISAAAIMWSVELLVTDRLLKQGKQPSVLKSINFPGSAEFNEKMYEQYDRTGV